MGMNASGEISDGTFAQMVEEPLVMSNRAANEFMVLCYARLKDNIMLIADGDRATKQLSGTKLHLAWLWQGKASGRCNRQRLQP